MSLVRPLVHLSAVGWAAMVLVALQLLASPAAAQSEPPANELTVLGEPGSRVLLDGHPVGQLPLSAPLLVAPGSHQVSLERGGRKLSATIQVRVGSFVDVRFDPETGAAMVSQPPTALVNATVTGGDPAEQALVQQALGAAMSQEGLHRRARPPAEVVKPTAACLEQPSCDLLQARQAGIPYVLLVSAAKEATGWRLECSLGDSNIDDVAASQQQRCDGCSAQQAADQLQQLTRKAIVQGLSRLRGRLEVRSEPPGASVSWKGRQLGQTPLSRPVFAGSGELVVQHAGYRPEHRQLQLAEGSASPVELVLHEETAEPEPEPPMLNLFPEQKRENRPRYTRDRRPTWRLVTGGVALAGGALLVGFGAGALSLSGSCIDQPQAPAVRCDQIYNTDGLGKSLLIPGALLSLGGALLMAIPGQRRQLAAAPLGSPSAAASASSGTP